MGTLVQAGAGRLDWWFSRGVKAGVGRTED